MGKTTVAIGLARHFHTSIISADSRQCFKELSIGVARPTAEELAAVPHYFIASHSIHDNVTAAVFEQYALQIAEELFRQQEVVVMTGGTGLYSRAFCEGLDEIPETDPGIRHRIQAQYQEKGIDWLRVQVSEKDPVFAAKGEMLNPQRMMRALEVVESSGRSILSYRSGKKAVRPFRIVKIGLELPKEELHARINIRVDEMMDQGLVEEVRSLLPYRDINALQTVGYREIIEYLDGHCTLEQAIEQVKTATRQYAKRQMTWFKKDHDIHWFHPADRAAILDWLNKTMIG